MERKTENLGLPEGKLLELKKHVAVIHSSNKLTLLQRKIANALLFNAYEDLQEKDLHLIHIADLCEMIGYASNDYKTIKRALVNLISTVLEWNLVDDEGLNQDGIWNASSIIAGATLNGAMCTYSYSAQMRQLLYRPHMYGRLDMRVQSRFQSTYGLALYENCNRFQDIGQTPWFDLAKFRKLMGVEEGKYKIFRDFKTRVLDKAMEEVNKYSSLEICTQLRKENRQVTSIQFLIKKNPSGLLPQLSVKKVSVKRRSANTKKNVNRNAADISANANVGANANGSANENAHPSVHTNTDTNLPTVNKSIPKNSDTNLNTSATVTPTNLLNYLKLQFGFSAKQAKEALAEYDENYIQDKINLVLSSTSYKTGKVKNLARYLISALRDDYQVPKKKVTKTLAQNNRDVKQQSPSLSQLFQFDLTIQTKFRRFQEAELFTLFSALPEEEKSSLMKPFEKFLMGMYLQLYLRDGVQNILIQEQLCLFLKQIKHELIQQLMPFDVWIEKQNLVVVQQA